MIPAEELRSKAASFGVPEQQVARDHLISHVLKVLSEIRDPDFTFFGGTALCRTWSQDTRLSEDIDLLVDDHVAGAESLSSLISKGLRREFPKLGWRDIERRHEIDTKALEGDGELSLRVQFVKWRKDWRALPLTVAQVRLRYSDLPEHVELSVPTPASFVAMKLMAWEDRQAPRDLFDLHELASGGHVTAESSELFRSITGSKPESVLNFARIPKDVERHWASELGHQLAKPPSPNECLRSVHAALMSIGLD